MASPAVRRFLGERDRRPGKTEVDLAYLADFVARALAAGVHDEQLDELARGIDPEENPASWVADEALWERAKKAVDPKWDDYDEPYAVVTHVYKMMGGSIR